MSEQKSLRVLQKNGRSYIELPPSYNRHGAYLVNGVEPEVAPGHPDWRIVDGDVATIVQVAQRSPALVAWKLRDVCAGLPGCEATRPADTFCRGEEYGSEHERHFYEPVLEDRDPTHTDIPFVVVNRDAEPVRLPEHVTVDFPASLEHPPELKYSYPCHIKMKRVFGFVADALVALAGQNRAVYRVKDMRNIQVLYVERCITIPPEARVVETETYYPRLNSRKSRTRKVTHTERWTRVLHLVGEYTGESGADAVFAKTVKGKSYEDLKARFDEYVQGFLDMLDTDKVEVCRQCKGSGLMSASEELTR